MTRQLHHKTNFESLSSTFIHSIYLVKDKEKDSVFTGSRISQTRKSDK